MPNNKQSITARTYFHVMLNEAKRKLTEHITFSSRITVATSQEEHFVPKKL